MTRMDTKNVGHGGTENTEEYFMEKAHTSTPAWCGTGALSVSPEHPSTTLRTTFRSGLEEVFDEFFVDAGEEGEFFDGDEFVF